MRDPRLNASRSPRALVLAAHGSADPRFGSTVESVATRVRSLRPGLAVGIGYLEHGPPWLPDVAVEDAVVVPLLLSAGYHVRVDLPAQAPGAAVAAAVGPDLRLATVLAERLRDAGYAGGPVALAAAGSADPCSLDDVRRAAGHLAALLAEDVTAAFVSAGAPRVADLKPRVVASYLLAPGVFHDALLDMGADVVSDPIGDHPLVAEIVLDRYDSAQTPGRTAPA